ncbi:hypothetical protein B7494_g6155 [Chlorociboria aeruginascens]|nr:hypothetical protein B7494_g6155 [Chlorociboria aeruginascens]
MSKIMVSTNRPVGIEAGSEDPDESEDLYEPDDRYDPGESVRSRLEHNRTVLYPNLGFGGPVGRSGSTSQSSRFSGTASREAYDGSDYRHRGYENGAYGSGYNEHGSAINRVYVSGSGPVYASRDIIEARGRTGRREEALE